VLIHSIFATRKEKISVSTLFVAEIVAKCAIAINLFITTNIISQICAGGDDDDSEEEEEEVEEKPAPKRSEKKAVREESPSRSKKRRTR
jgi:hypothetical protein